MKKGIISAGLILNSLICFSQNETAKKDVFTLYEDTLLILSRQISKGKTDAVKYNANSKFIVTFERALSTKNSFEYPFDSLKTIARLVSPDKKFKILNWNLPKEDGTHEYFGFVQVLNPKTKKYDLFQLADKSDEIKKLENSTTDYTKWFGVLYYKIILKKYKKKTTYTLLAWDGNNKLSSKKIIDVIFFGKDNVPKFGSAVFQLEKKTPKRVIFEYSSQATMSLKYDEQNDRIIFDHLAPMESSLKDQYQYYGPDLSFDAFEYKKGKWVYVTDIDARNKKENIEKIYNNPKDKEKRKAKELYNPSHKKNK